MSRAESNWSTEGRILAKGIPFQFQKIRAYDDFTFILFNSVLRDYLFKCVLSE